MDDAISRSAVLKVLEDHSCSDLEYYSEYEDFKSDIERLPALGVAPVVHARWKYKAAYSVNVRVSNTIYCTACGNGFHRIEGVNFRYCPNCGARMDGDDSHEHPDPDCRPR